MVIIYRGSGSVYYPGYAVSTIIIMLQASSGHIYSIVFCEALIGLDY